MAEIQPWLAAQGIDAFVVSFAAPDRLRAYQDRKDWPFRLFADPQRRAYRAFALRRLMLYELFRWRTLAFLARAIFRGKRPDRYQWEDVFQGGGDFLVDPDGAILYRHANAEPADRPSVADLKAALAAPAPQGSA